MGIADIWSRFFGRKDTQLDTIALVANEKLRDQERVSLQVLFSGELAIDAASLGQHLRQYHPSLRNARVELAPDVPEVFGLAGWDKHVVQLVGFNAPWPAESLEQCVAPAHYSQEIKASVRANRSHVLLYYAGYEDDPLERYVALAAVAGALVDENRGVAVLNEHAHTSLPAGIYSHEELGDESLEILRTLPLTMLYCGFVKYEIDGTPGVWMRTYGGDVFGIPDFAIHAEGHHQGQQYSDMFNNVVNYLRESGAAMSAGHTMQVGESTYMRLRDPLPNEYFLDGPGTVLVAEMIGASEINQG
ncbi:MAG: DUF4261 domain-containing protein [Gallionellaceae bacterium]|jgi:hypothetical protein|nr:DUF4261 domain-containing protein [Gallionellaceae bacterium]